MKSFRKVVDGEVRFSVSPNAPCPCGSQIPSLQCCLSPTGFHKKPALSAPRTPKTGKANGLCYASCLFDCDIQRSREHYVSESLLHYLNRENGLRVSGLPWIKGKDQALPPSALAAKVLCKRHNSALSKLDAIAVRLFQAFDEKGALGSGKQLIHIFNGHDIERWLLMVLCGITCSKNVPLEHEVDLSIPEYWLRILFGEEDFPEDQGLYVCRSRGYRFEGPHGLELRTITGKGRLSGMGLSICGYELILSMSGFPSRLFDGRQMVYRPLEFYATGTDFEKSIMFCWDGKADFGTISVTIVKT